jgi:hypothetical protein
MSYSGIGASDRLAGPAAGDSARQWPGRGREAFTYVHGQEFVADIRARRRDCRIAERNDENE